MRELNETEFETVAGGNPGFRILTILNGSVKDSQHFAVE